MDCPKKLRVTRPALVLNRFHHEVFCGRSIPRERGLFMALEGIALAGEELTLRRWVDERIAEVDSPVFGRALYIDRRAIEEGSGTVRVRPSKEVMLERMEKLLNVPYVWGGNAYPGVAEMLTWWPPSGELEEEERVQWTAAGVDCSGLLYQASEGTVPRNTRELVSYGISLPLGSAEEMAERARPLDFFVWPGHVLFVGRRGQAIESRFSKGGVIETDLVERLLEVKRDRGDQFFHRRLT